MMAWQIRRLGVVAAFTLALSGAGAAGSDPDAVGFGLVASALDGEPAAIEKLRGCAKSELECTIALAAALRRNERLDEAAEMYRDAVERGWSMAALALAEIHHQRGESVSAAAWARAFLENSENGRAALAAGNRGHRAVRLLMDAQEAMNPDQTARAHELAGRFTLLLDEAGPDRHRLATPPDPIERVSPRYPQHLALQHEGGWAIVAFRIRPNGRVGEAVGVDGSHGSMMRRARNAIRKWRFDPDSLGGPRSRWYLQVVEMQMDASAGV